MCALCYMCVNEQTHHTCVAAGPCCSCCCCCRWGGRPPPSLIFSTPPWSFVTHCTAAGGCRCCSCCGWWLWFCSRLLPPRVCGEGVGSLLLGWVRVGTSSMLSRCWMPSSTSAGLCVYGRLYIYVQHVEQVLNAIFHYCKVVCVCVYGCVHM